jgi:hypothetical protein
MIYRKTRTEDRKWRSNLLYTWIDTTFNAMEAVQVSKIIYYYLMNFDDQPFRGASENPS